MTEILASEPLKDKYADQLLHMQIDERVKIIKEFALKSIPKADSANLQIYQDACEKVLTDVTVWVDNS